MKLAIFMLSMAVLNAMAFDSAAWFEKRRLHAEEVSRLKLAYPECVEKMGEPAEDVVVPVEIFEDGAVRTVIYAKKAFFFLEKELVWAKGVKVIQFKPDRSIEFEIVADTCVVDRLSKNGWAPGRAKGKYDGTNISGKGIYFSVYENYVKVYENTDVESRDVKFGEVKL